MRRKLATHTLLAFQFTVADPVQGRSVTRSVCRPRALSCRLLLPGLLLIAACSPQVEGPPGQTTGVTVFEGARLIAGDGSEPIEDAAFIVENDRFTAIGRKGELQVPAGAARVDLTGKTVMPTLVDLHVHLVTHLQRGFVTFDPSHQPADPRDEREAFVDGLQRQAYFGVGAILQIAGESNLPSAIRNSPVPDGALVRDGGWGIRGTSSTSEAEVRRAVQQHASRHVDMIKIYVDSGDDRDEDTLTPALYGAIIDEANRHGLRVLAHLRHLEDAKGLLRAGLHGLAHGVRTSAIDGEFIALIKERRDIFFTPNLPPRGALPDLAWIQDAYPPEAFERIVEEVNTGTSALAFNRERPGEPFETQAANLARLKAEGIRIGLASDSAVGWSPHIEMEDMVAAGMTPAEVIVAATQTSAEILGLTDHGTVAEGKSASFIVLEANPLDNITNTRRIVDVYLRGRAVDRAALRARWTNEAFKTR
jgi:imidazolonepropionase-like amidohydrolase